MTDHPDRLPDQSWHAVVEPATPAEVENYLIDEIFKALGLRADSRWRTWFGSLFIPIVRGFSRRAAEFDEFVAQHGFRQAAQEWLKKWIPRLQIIGNEQIPSEGPLLIAANHPGTFDGLAVASALPRRDLRIVAAANPFFRTLPNTRRYFIYATRDTHVRMTTLRRALEHLQSGGALLIFPSGRLDPDPLHFKPAARQALARWSDSIKLLLRKTPQARLVLAINAGFVASAYLRHPFVRLRSQDEGRQKLAEFIQVIQQVVFNRQIAEKVRVILSSPFTLSQLKAGDQDIQQKIIETASNLLDAIPSDDIR